MRGERARRVLYIEDNVSNAALVTRALHALPWMELVVARRGATGLAELAGSTFDLLLLDLHLPDIGGEELLRRLRADDATRALPVVVISADGSPEVIARLRAAGADHYLTKPLDIGHLVSVVDGRSGGGSPTEGPTAAASGSGGVAPDVSDDVLDRRVLDDLRLLDDHEPGTLREVVELFAATGVDRIAAMEASHATAGPPDTEALAQLDHVLRGSGANLGAVDLARQCQALTSLRRRDDGELVRAQVARVRRSFEAAVAALRDHVDRDGERRAAEGD